MFRPASVFVALALATGASTAFAASAQPEPLLMTDAQMDAVTAGEGLLTIVLQDSFNNLTFNVGGTKGGQGAAKASAVPGNGAANGWEKGHGNPHAAAAGASSTTQNNTLVFQVNIVSNVNGAIAGGDAMAGQTVGTQTLALAPTRR